MCPAAVLLGVSSPDSAVRKCQDHSEGWPTELPTSGLIFETCCYVVLTGLEFCLSLVFIAVMDTLTKSSLRRKGLIPVSNIQVTSHHREKSGQKPKERP